MQRNESSRARDRRETDQLAAQAITERREFVERLGQEHRNGVLGARCDGTVAEMFMPDRLIDAVTGREEARP